MALTESTMELGLGTAAPDFSLRGTENETVSLADFAGRPLIVMFICNHCPYVKHLEDALGPFATEVMRKGIGVVAINSNDPVAYPDDSLEKMRDQKKAKGYPFPYLMDETQAVAKAYRAACTPDFYLFDRAHKLVYRGQFDDSRPGSGRPTGSDLMGAVEAVLAGQPVPERQRPSIGCNIKWKSGNAPEYFK